MTRTTIALLAAASLSIGATTATAEETTADRMVSAAMSALPDRGSTKEEFVPKNWRIYTEASGDLDGDGRADVALVVTPDEDDPANQTFVEQDDYGPAPDIAIVLFAEADGFRRVGANSRLSTRNFDGRPHNVEIAKRVLVINSNFGNSSATDVTYRFRYNESAGGLMLIGYDHEVYSRPGTEDAFHTSENYLTGVRIETVRHIDRRKKRTAVYNRETSKRSKIERYLVTFDEVDFDDDFENPKNRPFRR
jgi:hypothetical protein